MPVSTFSSGVTGFTVSGIHAGLKADGAHDMALIVSDRDCTAAGIFTSNAVKAAPVLVDQAQLKAAAGQGFRAVVVNTRCANACTGDVGIANAEAMIAQTARTLGVSTAAVLVMSTGVIGTQLPMPKISAGITLAAASLGQDWEAAARGIMTTDTRPKLAAVTVDTAAGSYTIAGIAKGAGMIAPNMATMLGVIVTDAALTADHAADALRRTGKHTFNRIVVDGDMSTNDTVLLLANGASGITVTPHTADFMAALHAVAEQLAKAIVRDGEGVTKFITLNISGAESAYCAQTIANTIAASLLVKTAFYGGDANWGRIVAAVGRSGAEFNPDRVAMAMGGVTIFEAGKPKEPDPAGGQTDALLAPIMRRQDISIEIRLGDGPGEYTLLASDLTYDYVKINADYRT